MDNDRGGVVFTSETALIFMNTSEPFNQDKNSESKKESGNEMNQEFVPKDSTAPKKTYTSATLKISLPEAFEDQSQMMIIEKMMGLQATEIINQTLPSLEKFSPKPTWGKYTVEGILAKKKFHDLLLAKDENAHRFCVLKVLKASPDLEPDQMQRFLDEAQILAQIEHPVFPAVYEIGVDIASQMYYAMPYISGITLQNFFQSQTPPFRLSPSRLLFSFYQLCHGIAYIHSHGILHRNLIPENIYVTQQGMFYAFGFSSFYSVKRGTEVFDQAANQKIRECGKLYTSDGRMVGDIHYMAPEMVREKIRHADERADVYSLGAILYYIMTGIQPFETCSFTDCVEQILNKEREIPKKNVRFPISRGMAFVIKKAMAIDRTQRYQGVLELIEDLEKKVLDKKQRFLF